MKLKTLFALASLLILHVCASASADNLYPLRGATKNQIQEQYGQPQDIKGPVGDPPITRWNYSDFSVVFEYDRVLDAFPRNHELEKLPASSYAPRPDPSVGDTLNLPD
ncbi:MAG: hypothetical protein JXA04_02025 [Gammaproteobacteria bacterium]|nr:hypothetical protein [Gammaproteobacteria bacterium]